MNEHPKYSFSHCPEEVNQNGSNNTEWFLRIYIFFNFVTIKKNQISLVTSDCRVGYQSLCLRCLYFICCYLQYWMVQGEIYGSEEKETYPFLTVQPQAGLRTEWKRVLVKKNHIWRFHAFTAEFFSIIPTFSLLSPTPLLHETMSPHHWSAHLLQAWICTAQRLLRSRGLHGAELHEQFLMADSSLPTMGVMREARLWQPPHLQHHMPLTGPLCISLKCYLEFWTASLISEALMEIYWYPPDHWSRFLLPYDSLGRNEGKM